MKTIASLQSGLGVSWEPGFAGSAGTPDLFRRFPGGTDLWSDLPRPSLRELAGYFFRVYGRFPGPGRWPSKRLTATSGDDGCRYPEGGALPRILGHGWKDFPGTGVRGLGWAGTDMPPLPGLDDYLLIEGIKREYSSTPTPFLVFDIRKLMNNYLLLSRGLRGAELYYPVKCNDHSYLLELLRDWGSGFEVASWGEIQKLLELGVKTERMIFGAPVKTEEQIASAYKAGVGLFAFDSRAEIDKLARAAPGSAVYLRLSVPELGASVFSLAGKFGVQPREALDLLLEAREKGLKPIGLSFHVGSQCLDPWIWWPAVAASSWVWEQARRWGLHLELLNLGGGIPVSYRDPVLEKEVFLSHLNLAVKAHFQRLPRLIIEPGRSLVGDAAIMVATVMGKARRRDGDWLYIDAGIYQGLVEAVQEKERFSYLVYAEGGGDLRIYNVGGPTCDAGDVVARGVLLPELECGDRVYILSAGAYSNVCATDFNGFRPPEVFYLSTDQEVMA